MTFSQLQSLTNYSFQQGASHPEELVERAHGLGYSALAITDVCSLAGIVKAHRAAKACGIHLIVGSCFVVNHCRFVLLAPNHGAYKQLVALITRGRRQAEKGEYCLSIDDLREMTLSKCLALFTPPHNLFVRTQTQRQKCLAGITAIRSCLNTDSWLGYANHLQGHQDQQLEILQQWSEDLSMPLTACADVRMHDRTRKPLLDVMCAIHEHTTVMELGLIAEANAEACLHSLPGLRALYSDALMEEANRIAGRCHFSLDVIRYQYPQEIIPPGTTSNAWLRRLVEQGVRNRWPKGESSVVRATIEKELALIAELSYADYFLTIYDIVAFAREQAIYCQGRGSAANSVVCYCLGITEIDPHKVNLLFERFISRERNEPPDIDVDFEHERREEVIQYIYEKYGRHRAAIAATVITYQHRSAIRDVAKALGFENGMIEKMSSSMTWWDKALDRVSHLQNAGLSVEQAPVQWLCRLVAEIVGMPRHLSQHVGGFVISRVPLDELVPVENAAMADRTIIQWDKDDLEAMGLLKVDVLALGMLTAIRKTVELINQYHDSSMSISDIPQTDDPAVYDQICAADTIGVFQIESRAQMSMLPRLKPREFYDLVIEVAIVRPGPIQGDMVHPYLRRRHGEEEVTYPSEAVREVLEKTLGVPIFQEQVIKLAMVAAGFSGGQADALRRAMAAWKKRGGLGPFEKKIVDGMTQRGYDEDFARRIFEQIKGFGEYGFPESHAASFALLAYQSAWLKHYHPAAFCCGLLNSLPMGFYSASQLIQDAKRHRVQFRPPDVNHSHWESTLERPNGRDHRNPVIRLGLGQIKGFPETLADTIAQESNRRPFSSYADFIDRVAVPRDHIKRLANSNALASLTEHRRDALWKTQAMQRPHGLFGPSCVSATSVVFPAPTAVQSMVADYQNMSLSLDHHPMSLLRDRAEIRYCYHSGQLCDVPNKKLITIAGLVTNRQRPSTAGGVIFMTLEDEFGMMNVVVWQSVVESQRKILLGSQLLKIKGVLERSDEGVTHIIAGRLINATHLLDSVRIKARNFC